MVETQDPEGSLVGVTLGSYRITDRIGAGGMGVVYRARDLRLDRDVAVKALPTAAESDPEARRRLMSEARRASRVVSPYVATVFDVVAQNDRAYIVMEHIEGRTLDEVIRNDRPSLDRITGFAVEIAEALSAIHAAGLIHRDLKPSNVMISGGHVKVMDFGLAREDAPKLLREAQSDSTLSTLTGAGGIAGTIPYMSPEQVRGEVLDARSDLFSFGTLLYEASAGTHPFERASLLASASAILNEPPSSGSDPSAKVPAPLAPIVGRLLEKDREKRYASAEAALDDLREARAHAQFDPEPFPRVSRAVLGWVAVLATITLVLFGASRFQRPSTSIPARPIIAILPFADRTGEPQGDLRAQLLADLTAEELSESKLVRALSGDRVREIVSGLQPSAPQLAGFVAVSRAADVRWILEGTLFKENDAYYTTVSILRPGSEEPIGSFRAEAGAIGALAAVTAAKLRDQLFPGRKEETAGPRHGSTSEEAQLLEEEARRAMRERRYRDAIAKLEQAVKLDPEFVTAQVRLADVLDRSGYATRAKEVADRAVRALAAPTAQAASGVDLELRAVAARIRGDDEAAIQTRRELVALHGDDPAARVSLAGALLSRGKPKDALVEAETAVALDAKDPSAHMAKARTLSAVGRLDDGAAELTRAESLYREMNSPTGQASVDRARADADYAQSVYPRAADGYQRAARAYDAARLEALAAQCRKGVGDCEVMQGRLAPAVAIYDDVLRVARSVGDHKTIVNTLGSVGGQYLLKGDVDHAEKVLREACDEGADLGNARLVLVPTLNLASALNTAGRIGESRPLAEEALSMARDIGDNQIQAKALTLLAGAQYQEGHLEEALRKYREILDSPSLANAEGTPLGNIYIAFARVQQQMGRMKDAAAAAELAVATNRTAQSKPLLGYSLVARAIVRTDLVLESGATTDLDEAEKLASDPAADLVALQRRVRLARAGLAVMRARWDDADRVLLGLRSDASASHDDGTDPSVFALSAQVAVERAKASDAIHYAQRAMEYTSASPIDRVLARVALARAYALQPAESSAGPEARRALDEAERLGLPLVTALASVIIANQARAPGVDAIRQKGSAALRRYVDFAPEDRRGAVLERYDVRAALRVLDSEKRGGTR